MFTSFTQKCKKLFFKSGTLLQYILHLIGMPQTLYIIAGCNGSGKTTASFTILPGKLLCKEFVNADEIAKGLSPFQPDSVAIEAGRLMLQRMDELLQRKINFAFETTLTSLSHVHRINKAKSLKYNVILIFFWLDSVELAIERVKSRVRSGGHNILEDVIRRRYHRGLKNLFSIFIPIVNEVYIYDNTNEEISLIAEKKKSSNFIVHDSFKFNKLKNHERKEI